MTAAGAHLAAALDAGAIQLRYCERWRSAPIDAHFRPSLHPLAREPVSRRTGNMLAGADNAIADNPIDDFRPPPSIRHMSDNLSSTAAGPLAVIVSLAFLLSGRVVSAAEAGWYIGAGAGESKIYDTTACAKAGGALDPGFSCRERTTDTATRIFGGYRFNQYGSAEVGYVDFGQFAASASGTKSGVPAAGDIVLKASGLSVDVDGILPITRAFGLLGRIGIVRWRTTESSSVSALGVSTTQDKSEAGVTLQIGAGVKYDFTRDLRGRAELVRYPDTNGRSQIDVLLVSVAYRLG